MSAQKRARAFSCPRFEFAVAQWRWRGRAPPPWAICAFFGRFSTNSPKSSPRAGQRSSSPHTNHGAVHLGPLYPRFLVIFRSFKTGLAGVDLPAFSFVVHKKQVPCFYLAQNLRLDFGQPPHAPSSRLDLTRALWRNTRNTRNTRKPSIPVGFPWVFLGFLVFPWISLGFLGASCFSGFLVSSFCLCGVRAVWLCVCT